jgi:predicted P-loop ATPase
MRFRGNYNRDDWNKDETGARRFWPIACPDIPIDLEAIQKARDQYFAEAVARFNAGETWWEMPLEDTRAEQESRYSEDPWTGIIGEFIALKNSITATEILTDCLKIDKGDIKKNDEMRVAICLRRLDWVKGKRERDPMNWRNKVNIWKPKED